MRLRDSKMKRYLFLLNPRKYDMSREKFLDVLQTNPEDLLIIDIHSPNEKLAIMVGKSYAFDYDFSKDMAYEFFEIEEDFVLPDDENIINEIVDLTEG